MTRFMAISNSSVIFFTHFPVLSSNWYEIYIINLLWLNISSPFILTSREKKSNLFISRKKSKEILSRLEQGQENGRLCNTKYTIIQ